MPSAHRTSTSGLSHEPCRHFTSIVLMLKYPAHKGQYSRPLLKLKNRNQTKTKQRNPKENALLGPERWSSRQRCLPPEGTSLIMWAWSWGPSKGGKRKWLHRTVFWPSHVHHSTHALPLSNHNNYDNNNTPPTTTTTETCNLPLWAGWIKYTPPECISTWISKLYKGRLLIINSVYWRCAWACHA